MVENIGGQVEVPASSAFPKVDERFWADESALLRHRLSLLEEYSTTQQILVAVVSDAEECRILEYQSQCLFATIAGRGKLDDAQAFVESRIVSGIPRKPQRFDLWWQDHKDFRSQMSSFPSLSGHLDGNFQCYHSGCRNYVYGFRTADDLDSHLKLHSNSSGTDSRQQDSAVGVHHKNILPDTQVTNTYQQAPFATATVFEPPRHSSTYPPPQLKSIPNTPHVTIYPGRPRNSSVPPSQTAQILSIPEQIPSLRSNKRSRPGMESATSLNPCLRCKILKKGCDDQQPCSGCPARNPEASDHWKALGCSRGSLVDLADKCLPERFKDYFKQEDGHFQHFILQGVHVEVHDLDLSPWLTRINFLRQNEKFEDLYDSCWEDVQIRSHLVSQIKTERSNPTGQDYSTAALRVNDNYAPYFGLLQLAAQEPFYMCQTAYNPFALLQSGRTLGVLLSSVESQSRYQQFFQKSKELLLSTVISHEAELKIVDIRKQSPATHRLIIRLPNVKNYLVSFLEIFDQCFSQRAVLSPADWLFTFYGLCIFSIVKCVLIDTLSLRANQPGEVQWNPCDAIQLNTIYKVLVSIFTWSAKIKKWCPIARSKARDPLLVDWLVSSLPEEYSKFSGILRGTQEWTRVSLWDEGGIKSSKDFLMNLGTGELLHSGFNGFLAQRFGSADNRNDRDVHRGTRELGTKSVNFDFPLIVEQRSLNRPELSSVPRAGKSIPEPAPISMDISSTFPLASKQLQRSYEWDRAETKMLVLYKDGRQIPWIVNSVIDEFFSGSDGKNTPSYNAVKRRLLAILSKEQSPTAPPPSSVDYSGTTSYIHYGNLLENNKGEMSTVRDTAPYTQQSNLDMLPTAAPSGLSSNPLAQDSTQQSAHGEAVNLYLQLVDLHSRTVGLDHEKTWEAMADLALSLDQEGNHSQGEVLHRRIIAHHERTLGTEHIASLAAWRNLSSNLVSQSKYEEAERVCRHILQFYHQNGSTDLQMIAVTEDLVSVLIQRGEYSEAERLLRSLLARLETTSRPAPVQTLSLMRELARNLALHNRYDEAETLLRDVYERCKGIHGQESSVTVAILNEWNSVSEKIGQWSDQRTQAPGNAKTGENEIVAQHLGATHVGIPEPVLRSGPSRTSTDIESGHIGNLGSPQMKTHVFRVNVAMGEERPLKKRREGPLTKERREEKARIRKLGSCPECRQRKVKCDPSHRRGGTSDAEKTTA